MLQRPRAATFGSGRLWLYGWHAVLAALANQKRTCHRLLVTDEAMAKLPPEARRQGLEIQPVSRADLDAKLGENVVHQGLALAVAPLSPASLERACAPDPAAKRNVVLVLDRISDPQNMGAILRSAAAFAARAVVVPSRHSAELGGATAKAASGALDIVPVVEVPNLAHALEELKDLGYWRIALDSHAGQSITTAPDLGNCALALGAEGAGLRRLLRERCDLALRLPMAPAMESLNVSVACAVALYELFRSAPEGVAQG